MFEMTNKRNMAIPTAVVAAVLMLCAAVLVCSPMSDATGEDLEGYGEVNEIAIAPGYSWSYTATFPSDLEAGTVLTFQVNELNSGCICCSLVGDFREALKQVVETFRITVNQALALDYSGCVEEIIQGTAQNITLSSTGGIGTVTWQEVSLPNGLTLSGNTISGTPTQIGENVVQVQAVSDKGETKDLEITFTVYNQIVGGSPQTITSAGSAAASDAIAQTGTDLGVTWAVTGGDLPEGFQLDAATGVVSGTYTGSEPVETTVTLTGTAANGPAQTATKEITIRGEPTFVINGENTVLTYTGNAEAKTLALTASATTSAITWTITEMTGVSVENGTVTVTGEAAVGTAQSATVTATTAYGQVQTKQITITVEDTLAKRWHVTHLPAPMNSNGDDFGITFDGLHNRGYFSSSRTTGGRGWDKIFEFSYPEVLQTVKGWVYEQDGYELPQALVYMVGNDGTYLKLTPLSDGSFEQPVKPGVDYVFLATCEGYLNYRNDLRPDSTAESHQYVLQFPLPSISAPVLVRNVFYEFDRADITPASEDALNRLVTLLNENPNVTIELSAHCDYRGNDDYNERLSQRRAESVVRYLTEHGITADRLTAKGYGEKQPKTVTKRLAEIYPFLHENDTLTEPYILRLPPEQQETCNALNRRTEFRVLRTTYGLFDEKGRLKVDALKPKTPEEPSEDNVIIE